MNQRYIAYKQRIFYSWRRPPQHAGTLHGSTIFNHRTSKIDLAGSSTKRGNAARQGLSTRHPGRPRKRGPRDGWDGMTLRILRIIIAAGPCGISREEIEKHVNISSRAILYHLKKLRKLGLIEMRPPVKSPGTIYISSIYLNPKDNNAQLLKILFRDPIAMEIFSRYPSLLFTVRGLAERLGVSVRWAQEIVRYLVERGFVMELAGKHCRYKVYMWIVVGRAIRHVHSGGGVHRFCAMGDGMLYALINVVKKYLDGGRVWDWWEFSRFARERGINMGYC